MRLCYGWQKHSLTMSGTRAYLADELLSAMNRRSRPHWLCVEGEFLQLSGEGELWLACRAAAAEHNALAEGAARDDGFAQEMAGIEARVQAHMADPAESEASSDGSVRSCDDLFDERYFYK